MKKLSVLTLGFAFALCLQAQTQAGWQTDTDGSVTGTAGTEFLYINEANFPDDALREVIKTKTTFNRNPDEVLTKSEVNGVTDTGILLIAKKITDITGIEYFTNIKKLRLENTKAGAAANNNIERVVLALPNLEELRLDYTGLTYIDVSGCPNLKWLDVNNNNLTDMRNALNSKMTHLDISENPNLMEVDLSELVNLEYLVCQKNKMTHLDLTKNVKLRSLYLEKTPLTELDLSQNKELVTLYYEYSIVQTLDLSENTKLKYVRLRFGKFDTLVLPVSTSLVELDFGQNKNLKSTPNISDCPNLTSLYCQSCSLTELPVENLTKLTSLCAGSNNISSIDVSNCTKLQRFWIYDNNLSSLDVSNNPELEDLDVHNNALKTLDLSHNPKIESRYSSLNSQKWTDTVKVLGSNREMIGIAIPLNGMSEDNIEDVQIKLDASYYSTAGYSPIERQVVTENGIDYLVLKNDEASDLDLYRRMVKYNYNPQASSTAIQDLRLDVTITYYPYVMYLHPATCQDGVYTGTLYIDYPAFVPEEAGAKCYYATGLNNDESLILQEITGTIPAKTPIVVTTTEPRYLAFYENKSNEAKALTPPAGNILAGSLKDVTRLTPRSVLTLGHDKSTGRMGFWNYSGTTVKGHRAYVPASVLSAAALSKGGLTFSFPDKTTGISKAKNNATENDNCYDLQGRLVKPTQKGVYIVNGKKIIK